LSRAARGKILFSFTVQATAFSVHQFTVVSLFIGQATLNPICWADEIQVIKTAGSSKWIDENNWILFPFDEMHETVRQ
jgi:hypothetical protein